MRALRLGFLTGLALWPLGAHGQVVERNLPAPASAPPAVIEPPDLGPAKPEDRSLGPVLQAILILGPKDKVREGRVVAGLDLSGAPGLDGRWFRREARPYLGRPLSKKLISDIQALVVRRYRQKGHPLVSVITPPQDLTDGRLQLRVIQFELGRVDVSPASPAEARKIKNDIRSHPGGSIDTIALLEDLDWLNRYPFRTLAASFSPGEKFAETNIEITPVEARPWRVYAGYGDTGSPSTGLDRYFLGALFGLPIMDATLSYQLTGSGDFFDDHNRLLGEAHPDYLSQGSRVVIPVGPRQDLEATFDLVRSDQVSQDFNIRTSTTEATVGYRTALTDLAPSLKGDLMLGLGFTQQNRATLFGGLAVEAAGQSVFQGLAAWSARWDNLFGRASLDAAFHANPFVVREGSGRTLSAYSNGRVTSARFTYLTFDLTQSTRVAPGWTLFSELIGQYAGQALPDTEQAALGGQTLVRGYNLDDGAFDDQLILRNEVRASALVLPSASSFVVTAEPLVFIDAGLGRSERPNSDVGAASAGFGGRLQMGAALWGVLDLGFPLTSLASTKAGDWRVDARVTATY